MEIKSHVNAEEVFRYMKRIDLPFKYTTSYDLWEKSYLDDIDGEGRTLFSDLTTSGAYVAGKPVGFIQYGKTSFGFGKDGKITDTVSYHVIRNFYFDKEYKEAGRTLLKEAWKAFPDPEDTIYAFFHYFGMSCYARHGKLFEGFEHIHNALMENGFEVEHENVFYSSTLNPTENHTIFLNWHEMTAGMQQYCDFILDDKIIGGCEIHFLECNSVAYLRWIFIEENLCGKGLGTKSMASLKSDLWKRGIVRFDTDTAMTNEVAQHFYDKNGFVREGITRSYISNSSGLPVR